MIHWVMLKKLGPEQTAIEMATLDQLVPRDHPLCKIDEVIDFPFIHDRWRVSLVPTMGVRRSIRR